MLRSRPWAEARWAQARWRDESGSAALEYVTAGLLLLLPLVYLVLVVAAVQSGALAAEAAARNGARLFVLQRDGAAASAMVDRAVRFALEDYGVDAAADTVTIVCVPSQDCLAPGTAVRVTVAVSVPLPLVPAFLAGDQPLAVELSATSVQRVSRFGPG